MNARFLKLPWVEIAILVLAVFLRFYLLDIKPAHFDEGINGWFADGMKEKGYYHYDPTNYHGPLHFYAVFISQELLGRSLFALRLPAILAGLACIGLILCYREFFGATTVRVAALAMAVSPAFVFYGRYSIHESWQVLFSLMMMWGVLGMWQKGDRRFLVACIAGLAGLILTKETYILHAGSFLLAAGTLWAWQKVIPSSPGLKLARQSWNRRDLIVSLAVSAFVIVLFYSGTFQDLPGLKGMIETFQAWTHTGVDAAGHAKTTYDLFGTPLNYYWLWLFWRYEWAALAGFAFCILLAGPADARLRFVAIYAAGILLAYSLIPYKTPWCIISMEWPFLLLFGAGIARLAVLSRTAAWLVGGVILAVSFGMMIRLNFFHFTDEKEPYVYVQTYPELTVAMAPLLDAAAKDPRYYHVTGVIMLDSYYPIPWILGDFSRIGYYKFGTDIASMDPDFVMVEASKSAEVEKQLKGSYLKYEFRLRDAQELCAIYYREKTYPDSFRQTRGQP